MNPATGIILAGGKSTRMKTDKAFLKLGPKTMIEELVSKLEKKFSKLMIIANDKERYSRFDMQVIEDIIPDKGPLGGIYTGLVKSDSFYNFIFSCDAPFVNPDLIDYMISKAKDFDIVVPKWQDRFEPLHAIYSKDCIEAIESQLGKNELKVTNCLQYVKVRVINEKEISRFVSSQPFFANINTPQDLYMLSQ
ncbi:MAG: molybdenum cofactor guanylyltransferase [Candidatus Omnitrophica bacterium]|nr:molybdenum cofactor guanylyltransferase [Candidatus Omnitrophota bacterium]MBU4590383.1 molybdenum cofactor guanylyltransferase [Candidatus Omnitrophota bacterium]